MAIPFRRGEIMPLVAPKRYTSLPYQPPRGWPRLRRLITFDCFQSNPSLGARKLATNRHLISSNIKASQPWARHERWGWCGDLFCIYLDEVLARRSLRPMRN